MHFHLCGLVLGLRSPSFEAASPLPGASWAGWVASQCVNLPKPPCFVFLALCVWVCVCVPFLFQGGDDLRSCLECLTLFQHFDACVSACTDPAFGSGFARGVKAKVADSPVLISLLRLYRRFVMVGACTVRRLWRVAALLPCKLYWGEKRMC